MKKMKKKTLPARNKEEKSTKSKRTHCHPNSKTVGCVSGIFHFFARHHNSSRKRLSSGGQRKDDVSEETKTRNIFLRNLHLQRQYRSEPLRSPMLASDIRMQRPATLVERLMGLGEFPLSSPTSKAAERCEERLASLKMIIDAARALGDDGDSSVETIKIADGNVEHPSPASVLDFVKKDRSITLGELIKAPQPLNTEKCDKDTATTKETYNHVARHMTMEAIPRTLKRSHEFNAPHARSEAMVETVSEVCRRSDSEEKMEAIKVAMALERGIFGDLVDEIGNEFALRCSVVSTNGTCRRRLEF